MTHDESDVAGRGASKRALAMAGVAPLAAASFIDPAGLAAYLPVFLILGFVVLLVAMAGWRSFSMNKRMVALGLVALFFGLALVPALATNLGDDGDDTGPGYAPKFEVILQGTRSTARDGATEMFDTQGGDGDVETPAGTLCAYGTNAEVDLSNKILRHAITVDDDVTVATAGFSAADICSADFSFRLLNPQDANGDGTMDSVSIFGRVRSISATVAEDGNGSSSRRNIFYRDTTFGWYLGWSRDVDTINTDGQWVSIAPAGTDDAALQAGHDYGWTNLGVNAGADEDYATYAYVLRNYGPFGFTLPVIGYQYTMLVDIGTPSDYTTLTVTIYLAARA